MSIEKVTDLTEIMNAIVEKAEVENRSLTDDEVQSYEEAERELQAIRKTDEVRSRNDAYKATAPLWTPRTAAASSEDVAERAFDTYLRTGEKVAYLERAQSSSTTAGGYLVPAGFREKLTEVTLQFGGVAAAAETITTDSGAALEWPTINDTANTGEIVAENGAPASAGADLVFGTVSLGAYKYVSSGASHLMLKVPVELLQDSAFDVQSLIARKLGERIARSQAADFAMGDGSGNPLGIGYAADGNGDVELADGNAITFAKLLATVKALDPSYRSNASWVMNDATWLEIAALEDGSGGRPLIQSASAAGLSGRVEGMPLLGYPVIIDNAFFAKSGDNSDNDVLAVFGDIREAYVIRRVKDITVVVDPYTFALNGQVGFLAMARADGTVQNAAARKLLAGYDATA